MIAEFDLKVDRRKPDREEMFNLKNKSCQEAFKNETEDNPELLNCFKNSLPLEIQSNKWIKSFNSILHKTFRKVRIVNNKKKENVKLKDIMTERIKKKQEVKKENVSEEMKIQIEIRIKQIEAEIEKEVTEEYQTELMETLRELGKSGHCINGDKREQIWKTLKKHYQKVSSSIPVGK